MAARIDWQGLMRLGLHGLHLEPAVFWRMTPVELRMMLGAADARAPLTRSRLAEMAAAFPDEMKGASNEPDRGSARSDNRA